MRLLLSLALLVLIVWAAIRFVETWAVNWVVDEAVHAEPVAFPTPSFQHLDLQTLKPIFPTFSLDDDNPGFDAYVP